MQGWIERSAGMCRSCGAGIWWGLTPARKRCCFDMRPADRAGGLVAAALYYWPVGITMDQGNPVVALASGKLGGVALENALENDREVYTSHFATCPDASFHRKAKR